MAELSRRDQILKIAEELFAERGFLGTNLDLVSTRLGLKRQAIYYYFKSKEEILLELVEGAGGELKAAALPILETDASPREKLERLISNHVRQVLDNVDIFRIQFREIGNLSPEAVARVRDDQRNYVETLAKVIAEGQKSGDFIAGSPVPMALMMIGMCNATLDWYQPGGSLSVSSVVELAVTITADGICEH